MRLKLTLVFLMGLVFAGPAASQSPLAVRLQIDGPIGPATSDYVVRGLASARERDADVIVLRLDTPGGLDTAMRDIIRGIIDSPVPVVSYVAPGGARAASAGTYIVYASHVAAMAPGTNLGAATPVQLGGLPGGTPDGGGEGKQGSGTMQHKMVNDAVAYIRSLANLRGRNPDWAEKAVREAASLPAEQAVRMHVVDLLAGDTEELLNRIDGREVTVSGHQERLHSAGARVIDLEPGWRTRVLTVLTNPNVAYVLMLIGIYGLIFELANPGAVVPGVIGGISLLLALFAFQALPINYAGLALIALGVALMISEAFVPSFGALGLGGAVAFAAGSLLLFDTNSEAFRISVYLVAGFTLSSVLVFLGAATLAVRAHRRPVVTGSQQMVGARGVAAVDFESGSGRVRVHSELWRARSAQPISQGETVRVTAMDGLRLTVIPEPDSRDTDQG